MPDGGMRYPSVAPVARRRSPASGCGGFFDGGMYNDNANAKQQHARRPRDEGVASAARYERPSPSFLRLLTYCPRDLGAFGDGAPPQARRHLNLDDNISGSPRTKFGYCVTVCNRRFQRWQPIIGARPGQSAVVPPPRAVTRVEQKWRVSLRCAVGNVTVTVDLTFAGS